MESSVMMATAVGCSAARSPLESALDTIISVFQIYSSKSPGGSPFELDYSEMRTLLKLELKNYMQECWDPRGVEEIVNNIDEDFDGKVGFEEFMALVIHLTVNSAKYFEGYTPIPIECGHIRNRRFNMRTSS